MNSLQILDTYISFFEKRGHKRIPNSPLVPENDPTTLFTSSGMQPLVPYLLGEPHPSGTRLVNVQNCLRAVDIEEVGDNRHTTFFRMLGNWSLGDYFKKEQLPWFWEFLTQGLKLDPKRLYMTFFEGTADSGFDIPMDEESMTIWNEICEKSQINPAEHILSYGVKSNWWSRSGPPDKMPVGEPGGPDAEIFYDFQTPHDKKFGQTCHPNCECGRFLEIGNSVFMEYIKTDKGFEKLPKANVDFGGGVERLLAAVEDKSDIFETTLFAPIIKSIEEETGKDYKKHQKEMRIIADHFGASTYLISAKVKPSKTEQGYVLRRLLRRGIDNLRLLGGENVKPLIETIVDNRKDTDPQLEENFEEILNTILEEEQSYKKTVAEAEKILGETSDNGTKDISADEAFKIYSTHGLSPTQIKNLGYQFDEGEFAQLMEKHAKLSRAGAAQKFAGGLADHSEQTIRGHTATHLMHQALRDMFGKALHQSGSNITSERVRFDFNFDRALTQEEIKKLEDVVSSKIEENLPVHFEIMPLKRAKELGAIGLFDEKYQEDVKIYFIGKEPNYYSVEFCGGPHVSFTQEIKSFKIIKQENIGKGLRRLYAKVG